MSNNKLDTSFDKVFEKKIIFADFLFGAKSALCYT
jgi:hypothetical protein